MTTQTYTPTAREALFDLACRIHGGATALIALATAESDPAEKARLIAKAQGMMVAHAYTVEAHRNA